MLLQTCGVDASPGKISVVKMVQNLQRFRAYTKLGMVA